MSSTLGAKRFPPSAQVGGRGTFRTSRPPITVYGPGGDLRCYMAHDTGDGDSSTMQQEQITDDGGVGAMATAPTSECAQAAYFAQECEMQLPPTQAPYYVDEYGHAHYLG